MTCLQISVGSFATGATAALAKDLLSVQNMGFAAAWMMQSGPSEVKLDF
jgi:hypothetical protein